MHILTVATTSRGETAVRDTIPAIAFDGGGKLLGRLVHVMVVDKGER